jgi:hypothetical protein
MVKRRHYNPYFKQPERLEPIFTLFLTQPDGKYPLRDTSTQVSVRPPA